MQFKTFTAPTAAEAMSMVRDELGEDAIIVTTRREKDANGVTVIASLESAASISPFPPAPGRHINSPGRAMNAPSPEIEATPRRLDIYETVCQALEAHGVPGQMVERLAHAAGGAGAATPMAALACALDSTFTFSPTPSARDAKPVMLVGPAGAGKTLTVAKLAAQAVMTGQSIGVITTDHRRAGAIEQLTAFMRILTIDLKTAKTPGELADAIDHFKDREAVYIDTAAVNPFLSGDMAGLRQLISATEVDPILILPAGGNPLDAAEIAQAFADIGTRRMIATRVDVARRIGCVLAAADQSRLAFCGVSITPRVAKGLSSINAVSLARMIMPETAIEADEGDQYSVPSNIDTARRTSDADWSRAV